MSLQYPAPGLKLMTFWIWVFSFNHWTHCLGSKNSTFIKHFDWIEKYSHTLFVGFFLSYSSLLFLYVSLSLSFFLSFLLCLFVLIPSSFQSNFSLSFCLNCFIHFRTLTMKRVLYFLLSKVNGRGDQCDQIGLFLKGLADKFISKVAKIYDDFLG